MTQHVVSASVDESLEECCQKMEENQVRRIPVTDNAGKCCGIVAQADIALEADDSETGEVVKLVSQPVGAGF
jgi:CBS-domain-containing membrane protein